MVSVRVWGCPLTIIQEFLLAWALLGVESSLDLEPQLTVFGSAGLFQKLVLGPKSIPRAFCGVCKGLGMIIVHESRVFVSMVTSWS